MSLKTRCPACDTVFKIVPDQLKVSSGWVRCGRCAEVFDAASHAVSPEISEGWPQPAPAVPAPADESAYVASKKIEAFQEDESSARNNEVTADLAFVRIAKNKAFWKQRSVINSLRAVCIGLAGLLFLQVVFSQRDHLAATNPALKTSLESVCQAVGCKIDPFKDIDAFKIDSSSFQKAQIAVGGAASAEVFALKLTLKNSLDIPVAMPAVELTLTEAGDKPVLRRILPVKDLGFNGVTLAANSDWTGSVMVAVTPNAAMPPISGYRVLLFYP
jgi:predicted Zn finger-like uncharacterized protein